MKFEDIKKGMTLIYKNGTRLRVIEDIKLDLYVIDENDVLLGTLEESFPRKLENITEIYNENGKLIYEKSINVIELVKKMCSDRRTCTDCPFHNECIKSDSLFDLSLQDDEEVMSVIRNFMK